MSPVMLGPVMNTNWLGRGLEVTEYLIHHGLIDWINPLHWHDGDMKNRGQRDKPGLIFVMNEAQSSGLGHGEIGPGDSGLGFVKNCIPKGVPDSENLGGS